MESFDFSNISDSIAKLLLERIGEVKHSERDGVKLILNDDRAISRKDNPEMFNYALERVMTSYYEMNLGVTVEPELKRKVDNLIYSSAVTATKYGENSKDYILGFLSEIYNGTQSPFETRYDGIMTRDGSARDIEHEFWGNKVARAQGKVDDKTMIDAQIEGINIFNYILQRYIKEAYRINLTDVYDSTPQRKFELMKQYFPDLVKGISEQAKVIHQGIRPDSFRPETQLGGTNWWGSNMQYALAVVNHYFQGKPMSKGKNGLCILPSEDEARMATEYVDNMISRGESVLKVHSATEAEAFSTRYHPSLNTLFDDHRMHGPRVLKSTDGTIYR